MRKLIILIVFFISIILILIFVKTEPSYLYIPDSEYLNLNKINIKINENGDKRIFIIFEKLKNSERTAIPEGTELLSVKVVRNIVHLNFNSEFHDNHPGGSSAEILTIYSIVNSITSSMRNVNYIKFYINNEEIETLKGHIDLRYPLAYKKI